MNTSPATSFPVFATTHWSVVLAAGDANTPVAREAWEQLARSCWSPLYAHARRRGRPPEDARDLVQSFFARLVEKPVIQLANPARGRFRSFLLTAFDHFLSNAHDHAHALKRGGGMEFLPLLMQEAGAGIEMAAEPIAPGESPESRFDRDWAQATVARALAALAGEFAAEGKTEQFEVLRPFLFAPPGPGEYEDAATRLGLRAVLMPKAVARLRQRLRLLVRSEVAQTVATVQEVEEEMRYLVTLIAEA